MTLATAHPPTQAAVAGQAAGALSVPGGPGRTAGPRTDRRLRRTRILLTVGALLFGVMGITETQIRADGASDARSHSGVLIQQAEQLYHNLSDADATSATIYLHVGEAPKDLVQRYDDDLKRAQAALLAATNEAGSDGAAKDALAQIAQQLPQYVKLNATAAANNLIGYPVGFRYLIQASNLMQGTSTQPGILTAAQNLSDAAARDLAAAEDTATQFPWLTLVVGLLLLAALLVVQVRERQRTNRVLNVGLVGATIALVLSLAWTAGAFAIQNSHVDNARKRGSDQVRALATARVLSLQGRTDEMLTLVGRGTADDKEAAFSGVGGTAVQLESALQHALQIATDHTGTSLAQAATGDEVAWKTQHQALWDLDQQNEYQKAVDSALGEHTYAAPKPSANQSFQALQADLDKAINHAENSFQSEAKAADEALTGLEIGLGVLAVAMAAAVVVGLGRRIAEYQ